MKQRKSRSFVADVLNTSQAKTEAKQGDSTHAPTRHSRHFMDAVSGGMETKTELKINPARCRIWQRHNRFYRLLDADSCADLVAGFKTQGQTTACVARKVTAEEGVDFEIICGARRHWTAAFLGMDLKIEVRDLSDHQAFLISDAENKDRQDISDYERALEYLDALGSYYDNKQEAMAREVGMSTGQLSKYLGLARLDKTVVSAFSDPRWIKVHHGQELRSKLQGSFKLQLLANVKAIKSMPQDTAPKDGAGVMKLLLATPAKSLSPSRKFEEVKLTTAKTHSPMLSAKLYSSGRINIDIVADSGAGNNELIAAIRELLSQSRKKAS